ncbi:MAG: cysteine--tRNA ligase [Bacilli bacterium]|nr:cysteine--tRNA ligase [Bacilli bacterium]
MNIFFYNSLTKKRELFKSIKKNKVSIYVCGPTVYDHLHIGNLRPIVVFDVLHRFFNYLKYKVTFVSNFTDIDDKIINKASIEKKTEKEIADFYIKEAQKIIKKINCLKTDFSPRVTNYIDKIIIFIQKLIENNNAYVNNDGNVLFDVKTINNYGELSNINIEKLIKNNDDNIEKKNNLDFVLWKKTNAGIQWDSPWGRGRPGWHTECCVMINDLFSNKKIDIHGGGFDLKFPHHENEIAQNKAAYKNKLANYWLHNGFIMIKNNKMSKSLKNFIFVKDLMKKYDSNSIRLLLLQTHYRSPLSFDEEKLILSKEQIKKITSTYNKLAIFLQKNNIDNIEKKIKNIKTSLEQFLLFLADDLNMSLSLSYLYGVLKKINLNIKNRNLNKCLCLFKEITDIFYILGFKINYYHITKEDKKMLKDFENARKDKNFVQSDKLRKKLIKKELL